MSAGNGTSLTANGLSEERRQRLARVAQVEACIREDRSFASIRTPNSPPRYGVRWMPVRAHVSLGVSAYLHRKFGHVSIHLPFGVLVIGFTGRD